MPFNLFAGRGFNEAHGARLLVKRHVSVRIKAVGAAAVRLLRFSNVSLSATTYYEDTT